MNPMQAQPPADPSAAGPTDPSDQDDSGGFCIELHVASDGSITVSVESEAEESQEEGGDDDQGKPAKNIKDALTMALEIYKNNGEAPDDTDSDDQFSQGLGSRSAP